MKLLPLLLVILFINVNNLQAQETNSTNTDSISIDRKNAIKLFVDCQWCDIEHFKKKITLVNYVRDRKDADVHLMITEMETGSGGTEYTLAFYGTGKYKHLTDTISFALPPNSTDEEEREAQIKYIKIGLVPFILKTPFANKLSITYEQEETKKQENIEDKWKSWVFSADLSGWANGEDMYTSYNLWSNISVSKVTPDIKIEIDFNNNFSESIYRFENDTIVAFTRSNHGNFLITKSIGEHWAVGGFAQIYGSTYSNIQLSSGLTPAVEYNLFKYKDATTKQLRFLYRIGFSYNDYLETTIFNKTEELFFYHHLSINYKNVQQWGTIEGSVYGSTFLHDFSKNKIGLYIGSSIRLFKGLSFRVYGGYTQKRDQITLPKEESSTEEVLLRKKEMASDYNYWVNFGLSYTFGSMYNNVVNPRFDD